MLAEPYPWYAFSDRARRAIALANQQAHSHSRSVIDPEDLWVGATIAVDADLNLAVGAMGEALPFSPEARVILERVRVQFVHEANACISVEHLIAAICKRPG
jgi:hypothetical protein